MSETSMTAIAQHKLAPLEVKGCESLLVNLHLLSRLAHSKGPLFFINLLDNYSLLLKKIRGSKDSQALRLKAGLAKLEEANSLVKRLSTQAREEEAKLTAKQKEADKALVSITAAMKQAAEQKAET